MKPIVQGFMVTAMLMISSMGFSQTYVFKVLANKGENTYKNADSEWAPLKTGQSLNSGDELKLSNDAYLGLMHNTGKTLEVKSPGTHTVSSLATSLKNKNSSVASKYADFVLNKMTQSDGETDYRKSLNATGAVDRALSNNASIQLMAHSSSEIVNSEVVIRWNEPKQQEGTEEELTYELKFMNLFDEEILSEETQKTSYMLNMNEAPFKDLDAKFVKVKVSVKGKDLVSDEYAITVKPEDEAVEIKQTLSSLKTEVDEETAMNNMVLAAFYEENNLLLDALTAYERAIQLAPEVEVFQTAYANFLIRNGFGK